MPLASSTSIPIAFLPALPEQQPTGITVEGYDLVLVRDGEQCHVFAGYCLHQRQALADGTVENGQLICPAHGWRYRLSDGQLAHDQTQCLHRFRAWVEDQHVCVDIEEIHRWKRDTSAPQQPQPNKLRRLSELDGPPGWPFLGSALELLKPTSHAFLETGAKKYGSLYQMKLGKQTVLVVADGDIIQSLLRARPEQIRRYHKMGETIDELGIAGVFSAEGEKWKRQRHFAARALAQRYVRAYAPIIAQKTEQLLQKWHRIADQQTIIDPSQDLMRFTVDVTTQLAFGYEMNTLSGQTDSIQRHLEQIFPMIQRRTALPFPYWRYVKFPIDRRLDEALVAVRTHVQTYIDEARQRLANEHDRSDTPYNFLEALLNAEGEDGSLFNDEEVFGNVFTMLLAGEDTTAHSIAWVIEALLTHPDVQTQVQAEVDGVMGVARTLTADAQPGAFPYLSAVIHETMRLRPVGANLLLDTLEDMTLGDVQVPAGTTLFALLRPTHLDPVRYPEPQAFRPERWLEGTKPTELLTFGHGPRLCPGRNLALLEMTHVLAMLCRNFHMQAPADTPPVTENHAFVVKPEGLRVKIRRRQ